MILHTENHVIPAKAGIYSKWIPALFLFIVILFTNLCLAMPPPKPFPPFHIMGNLYYVGTDDLASYLIVTSKGNILINSDLQSTVPMIKANIEKLGFKFSDIKILLISHAHYDHAGGSKLIKEETHATYMVMDADVPVIESGGKSDFAYANKLKVHFPPTTVDKILHDGDQVKLGGTILTAHLTPGHTPGCTTWTMIVTDHGRAYHVVILGSENVNGEYKLVNNTQYPTIAKDYEQSFKTLKSLPCDIFLGAHGGFFNLKEKYPLLTNQFNPFIDPLGYKKYIAKKERAFYKKLNKQRVIPAKAH